MYFLSNIEHKILINKLLPSAREVGITNELRGWNWHTAPLKPYYEDIKLPIYIISSQYCPTGRDIYLRFIEKTEETNNLRMTLRKILHGVVSDCPQAFIQQQNLNFNS